MYVFSKRKHDCKLNALCCCLGEYGQKRASWYFLDRNYWCGKKHAIGGGETHDMNQLLRTENIATEFMEDMTQEFHGKEVIR